MKAVTMIYMAVALSTSLSIGVLGAFFWSERRCRERERWLRDRCTPSRDTADASSAPADESQERLIPIHRRPFHEALWEDEPELAPSPQLRAFLEGQALHRKLEPPSTDEVSEPPISTARQSSSQKSVADVAPSTHEVPSAHEENDEMMKQKMAVAALATAGLLSACQAPLAKPEFRRNPHPRERYEITMTIQDAPGPFTYPEGTVFYEVQDKRCGPTRETFQTTHWLVPDENIKLVWTRLDSERYRTEMVVDALLDEDYYGLGVCRWEFVNFAASMFGQSVDFIARLDLDELRAQRPKTLYYSNRTYWSSKLEDWPDSGESSVSDFGFEVQDELFTITLTPRRIAP